MGMLWLAIPLGLIFAFVVAVIGILWGIGGGLTGAPFPLSKNRTLAGLRARLAHVCCSAVALAVACEITYFLPYVTRYFFPEIDRFLTRD